jgi:hypothetical protein
MSLFSFASKEWKIVSKMTIKQLASEFEISEDAVKQSLSPIQLAIMTGNEEVSVVKKFNDEDFMVALREAQTFVFPLTVSAYANLLDSGEIQGPSVPLITKRFGTWARACLLAGVESGKVTKEHYAKEFTDFQILEFVRKFMSEQDDANWSITRYVTWRDENCKEAPSMALIRSRIGNWIQVRVDAINQTSSNYDLKKFYEL